MPNPFPDLVARLDQFPPHLGEIVDEIRLAIKVAAITPDLSLTQTRKVLERIAYDVFKQAVGQSFGTGQLEGLLKKLVSDKHLPEYVYAYAMAVKELGNAATHSNDKRFTREDVARSIGQLLSIVDWYDNRNRGSFDNTHEGSSGSCSGQPLPAPIPERRVGAEVYLPGLWPLLDDVAIPVAVLLKLYRESAPAGWEPPPPSHEPLPLLSRCVASLARASRQQDDGLFPLFRFVRGLRDGLKNGKAEALDEWLDASLVEMCLDPIEALRLRSTLERSLGRKEPQVSDCYLLVQVSPREFEAARYRVQAWLFGTEEPVCGLLDGEEAMTLDQVQDCLDELSTELYRRVDEPDRAWVELLLPRELLCLDVDQWRIGVECLEPSPLGVEHRLVVRSLDRARRPKAAISLQARGKALGRKLEESCPIVCGRDCETLWIGEDQPGGLGLLTTLRDARWAVGAALGAPPHSCPRDPKGDVLETLFTAGFPVVLWSRRPVEGGPASTQGNLLEFLGHEPFGRLRDRVWELRKEATRSGDDGHIGRHLTLLWDDPARTSPDFEAGHRLRAPTRE